MESDTMVRVLTEATISNVGDLYDVERGRLTPDAVRSVYVPAALVDTGATTLSMPKSLLDQLGLTKQYEKRAITAAGERMVNIYQAAQVEIRGRKATVDVIELPEGNPVLIGQMPLEFMDWVVDMRAHKLIGNPAHGGEHVIELL